jgi:ferric-dicitrate binding protein FerR (iron transport regulator)
MADQQPIDDALLGKFLAGETSPAESVRVRQWLANRKPDDSGTSQEDFARFERIWEAAARLKAAAPPSSSTLAGPADQPAVDTDAAWRVVQQKMRSGIQEPVIKPLPVQRDELRSPTVIRSDWSQLWYRIAAVLVLVGGMGWLSYRFLFFGHDHPARNLVVLTTNQQQLRKTLPDGTRILLNRHSTLQYPASFDEERRDVTLTGEAFFDVTPDASRPFRIQARKTAVQVLGTSFSVRAYDANVSVAVQTGKVRFASGQKAVLLTKNQQATFEASADTIRRVPQLSPNAFAYKTGQLVFTNEPLRDVVQAINGFYNADVRLANAKLGNCRLTTRFDKTSFDAVLAVTAETLGLQIHHEGQVVILDGIGCP